VPVVEVLVVEVRVVEVLVVEVLVVEVLVVVVEVLLLVVEVLVVAVEVLGKVLMPLKTPLLFGLTTTIVTGMHDPGSIAKRKIDLATRYQLAFRFPWLR